ncbi:MAG: glutamate--cysteine ligase [Acidimicrobiia bacterium]|nr:glutamate--cysteine ligase [Acidimicrobiia bacterium]
MAPEPEFTVGVEEEFFVVDAETLALRHEAEDIVARSDVPPDGLIEPELKRSQVETGTAVAQDAEEIRSSITALRSSLAASAREHGGRLLASGTHPFAHWRDDGGVTPKRPYERLRDTYARLTDEQVVSGCHVHVGVRDPDLAVEVMNRARAWIPLLIAISANSPFWLGDDSGYASYRTQVFHRWPNAGAPEHFASRTELDWVVDDLLRTGLIDDRARIYWDIRPSARYPTLEFRAADVMTNVDDAVAVALLVRALVQTCHAEAIDGEKYPSPRPELLRGAIWQASRFGLQGDLIDVAAARAIPAAELVGRSLAHLRPVLEDRGEWDEVQATVDRILREGTGADRQRATLERTGDLRHVVDQLVADTA